MHSLFSGLKDIYTRNRANLAKTFSFFSFTIISYFSVIFFVLYSSASLLKFHHLYRTIKEKSISSSYLSLRSFKFAPIYDAFPDFSLSKSVATAFLIFLKQLAFLTYCVVYIVRDNGEQYNI